MRTLACHAIDFITIYSLCYTVSPMKGGTRHGLLTVHRSAVPPHGVPGFDEDRVDYGESVPHAFPEKR
jgi:hypothetical protein